MIEHVWFWQPVPGDTTVRYGEPPGLVVGKIISKVTARDINIEITHSVHPRFKVGDRCKRCRMKTRDAVIVDGVPQDRQTGKTIMPSKPEGKEIPSEGNEDAQFDPNKYIVIKTKDYPTLNGTEVAGHFVLMPEKDPAALQALRAYAANCKSPKYQKELIEWITKIEREIVSKWSKGENLGSLGRINAGIDKLV